MPIVTQEDVESIRKQSHIEALRMNGIAEDEIEAVTSVEDYSDKAYS